MSERIPETPPVIKPVISNGERPLWSVMIPTYNCICYLKKALEGVLAQDPGPEKMQIEVIDDCSVDGDVEALVQEIGKGRVGFFQQPKNRGSLRNFETCLNRSKGKWIHLLHGDDSVKVGFYQEMESLLSKHPEIGAAFSKYTHIDENGIELVPGKDTLLKEPGIVENFLFKIAQFQQLQPPAIVVKRSVYEQLGGFFAVHYGEDWEMWTRIAAHYPVAYSPKCLALYRRGHATNITSHSLSSGQNIKDILKVVDIVQNYLPQNKRSALKGKARKTFSIHFAMASNRIFLFDKETAFLQAKGALKLNVNLKTLYWIMKLYIMHIKSFIYYKTVKMITQRKPGSRRQPVYKKW